MKFVGRKKNLIMLLAGVLIGTGLGVLVIFGIAGGDLPLTSASSGRGGTGVSPVVGSPAPDFELLNLAGEKVSLSDYRGKSVVVNFWATWCGPCAAEMPLLQSYYENYGEELVVLAVNFAESQDTVQKFVDEYELTFPVVLDSKGAVQKLYKVRGYPSSYLVDADGIVQYYHVGLITQRQLDRYLEELGVGG